MAFFLPSLSQKWTLVVDALLVALSAAAVTFTGKGFHDAPPEIFVCEVFSMIGLGFNGALLVFAIHFVTADIPLFGSARRRRTLPKPIRPCEPKTRDYKPKRQATKVKSEWAHVTRLRGPNGRFMSAQALSNKGLEPAMKKQTQ